MSWPTARWVHIEGVAGYVFPNAGRLLAERRERTGTYRAIKVDSRSWPDG
jgi:hyaluronate lyase